MPNKLNIRELLAGTEYESQADMLAIKIEGWGLDNDQDIYNLPIHGKIAGTNPNLIIEVLISQSLKDPAEPAEPQEPAEINASQAALDLATEKKIDLASVNGSGKDGIILKSDIEKLINLEEDNHDD